MKLYPYKKGGEGGGRGGGAFSHAKEAGHNIFWRSLGV